MAVARVKLTKRQHNYMAALCARVGLRAATREFRRAHDRPGLTAELGADEWRTLWIKTDESNVPGWALRTIQEANEAVEAGEAREQERTRALRARLNERYPGRNG